MLLATYASDFYSMLKCITLVCKCPQSSGKEINLTTYINICLAFLWLVLYCCEGIYREDLLEFNLGRKRQ